MGTTPVILRTIESKFSEYLSGDFETMFSSVEALYSRTPSSKLLSSETGGTNFFCWSGPGLPRTCRQGQTGNRLQLLLRIEVIQIDE